MESQSPISEIRQLLPKYDCGACGYPECRVFARRYSLGAVNDDACPFLTEQVAKELRSLHGIFAQSTLEHTILREVIVQPCVEEGKMIYEMTVPKAPNSPFPVFDVEELCHSMQHLQVFTEVRCAIPLGYILGKWDNQQIHIYQKGKMVTRKVNNREQGISTLAALKRNAWPALIDSSGFLISDFFAGVRPIGEWFPTGLNWRAIEGADAISSHHVPQILRWTETHDANKHLTSAWKLMDAIFQRLTICRDELMDGSSVTTRLLSDLGHTISYLIVSAQHLIQMAGGMMLYGILHNFRRVFDALLHAKWGVDSQLLWKAREIFETGYIAFRSHDREMQRTVLASFVDFQERWQGSEKSPKMMKVAYCGRGIAHLC